MTRTIHPWLLLALLLALTPGCEEEVAEEASRSVEEKAGDELPPSPQELTEMVPVNPSGRTELPTYNTGAGPMFITLPERFDVRADRGLDYDMIFLYLREDPIITGSSDRPPYGIARIQISDSSIKMDLPGARTDDQRMVVGGVPVTAEHSIDVLPHGGRYHSYSISIPHFFASRDRSLDDLHLHVYVGGSDSAAVAALLESLATLSFQP